MTTHTTVTRVFSTLFVTKPLTLGQKSYFYQCAELVGTIILNENLDISNLGIIMSKFKEKS